MTTPMPTIFDINAQPEEGDYFEPTAADYAGDTEFCMRCGLVKETSPSPVCDACDTEDYEDFVSMWLNSLI